MGHSPIDGALEWMMDKGRENALHQWDAGVHRRNEQQPGQRPGILFENTTIGTLSIDGDFVYTVDDLAVPKPPNYRLADLPRPAREPIRLVEGRCGRDLAESSHGLRPVRAAA